MKEYVAMILYKHGETSQTKRPVSVHILKKRERIALSHHMYSTEIACPDQI
jgi:hypothetical protein